ncbi:hypothetical protein LTR50_007226 [Elasticomyces elasticus]|nr:hypothetical protein LTR50_007226 [Elasticomyces elasticus]
MATSSASKPTVLILIANGTEEIEFVTLYDVCVRAGFSVHSIGVGLETNHFVAKCSRNIRLIPDYPSLNDTPSTLLDNGTALILPGGAAGAKTFSADASVLRLIREYRNDGKHVACICAGTTALVASVADAAADGPQAAQKCRVTSHPSVKAEIVAQGWEYAADEERVVVDGRVVTSRGPGTALLFALTIVEILAGREKRMEVEGPMVCAEVL